MAWERRGDNRQYYDRSRRDGGRVVRDYLGDGAAGQLAADLVAEARERRAARAQARKAGQARLEALDQVGAELDRACELVIGAALAAGDGSMQGRDGVGQGPPPGPIADLDEVRSLLGRAAGGDPEALAGLRALLDDHPALWQALGVLAAHVERAWVGEIAGPNPALAEVLTRRVAGLKRELGGPAPSPLERLLVDRIAACWLQVHHADLTAARPGAEAAVGGIGCGGGRPPSGGTPGRSRRWRGSARCCRPAGDRTRPRSTSRRGTSRWRASRSASCRWRRPARRRSPGSPRSAGPRPTRGRARPAGEPGRA